MIAQSLEYQAKTIVMEKLIKLLEKYYKDLDVDWYEFSENPY